MSSAKCYSGYSAYLTVSEKSFDISDNCGGIPQDAIKDAFLLGRPKIERNIPTIGMYGIGMKRAIFKIGEEAAVKSFATDGAFRVSYTREWLDPKNDRWDLPIESPKNQKEKGVVVVIPTLRKEVAAQFGNDAFVNNLKAAISRHFGYIIQKGFSIFVNKEKLRDITLKLFATDFPKKAGIRPYDFELDDNGIHIRVTVGFFDHSFALKK